LNFRRSAGPSAPKYGFFKARVWQGMTMSVWLRHLWRNRFAVSPRRIPQALRLSLFATFSSLLHGLDWLLFSRRVSRTTLAHPPLFVIGHWRTGTTLLHELLALDDRFTSPTTYQCFAPLHFLVSDRIVPTLLPHLMSARRPMDDMTAAFDTPQEDEIALCNMGLPSPYSRWLFPNNPDPDAQYFDLANLSPRELKRWHDGLRLFLRRVALRDPRRLVLKTPLHTARVARLAAMFPGSQFIHIVRDPFVVFPSTAYTCRRLWSTQGFQNPRFEGLEEYVFTNFERMYKSFEDARPQLGPRQLYELRYEDLVRAPVEEMRKLYAALELGDIERVRPALEGYFARARDYRTNRFELTDDLRRRIGERWAGYIRRYGYDAQPSDRQPAAPSGEASSAPR
jgi:hypothetical protein